MSERKEEQEEHANYIARSIMRDTENGRYNSIYGEFYEKSDAFPSCRRQITHVINVLRNHNVPITKVEVPQMRSDIYKNDCKHLVAVDKKYFGNITEDEKWWK